MWFRCLVLPWKLYMCLIFKYFLWRKSILKSRLQLTAVSPHPLAFTQIAGKIRAHQPGLWGQAINGSRLCVSIYTIKANQISGVNKWSAAIKAPGARQSDYMVREVFILKRYRSECCVNPSNILVPQYKHPRDQRYKLITRLYHLCYEWTRSIFRHFYKQHILSVTYFICDNCRPRRSE